MTENKKKLKKSRSSFSSDPLILQQFENKIDDSPNWDSKSQWIEEQMSMFVNSGKTDLEKKEHQLKKELSKIEQNIYEEQQRKESKMNELKTVQAQLEAQKEAEKRENKDKDLFLKAGRRKYKQTRKPERFDGNDRVWAKPSHISDRWVEDLGKSKEELFELIEKEVVES